MTANQNTCETPDKKNKTIIRDLEAANIKINFENSELKDEKIENK